MRSARGVKHWPVITRRFLITRCRYSILKWRPQRRCKSSGACERMSDMFFRRNLRTFLLAALFTVVCSGCKKTADAPASPASGQAAATTSESAASHAIETETVVPQPIAGAIVATGKILVSEDRMANIGPVHEGRLVRLYAGQGSVVSKGQKLADLESADIDEAESDYHKALAEYENARRTSEAEIKLAQSTYDRTKMLFEKTITAGKNLQAAEHDLEVAKASAANTIASTKAALAAARRRLLILGLKASDINALTTTTDIPAVHSLTSL